MKKIILVSMLFPFLFISDLVNAQNQPQTNKTQQNTSAAKNEFLIMKGGKVYHTVNGKQAALDSKMRMNDGTIVNPDGTCKLINGKEEKFHNGECMDMTGKIYHSQEMYQERMLGMHNMNGGKMMDKDSEHKNMGGMKHN